MKNNNLSSLNELGCVDELEIRLTKLQGILGALISSSDGLDQALMGAAVWAASDLVDECVEIKNRTAMLLPRC